MVNHLSKAGLFVACLMAGSVAAEAGTVTLSDAQLDGVTAGAEFPEFSMGKIDTSVGTDLDFTPIGPKFGDFDVFEGPLNPPPPPAPEPEPVPNNPRNVLALLRDTILGRFSRDR